MFDLDFYDYEFCIVTGEWVMPYKWYFQLNIQMSQGARKSTPLRIDI